MKKNSLIIVTLFVCNLAFSQTFSVPGTIGSTSDGNVKLTSGNFEGQGAMKLKNYLLFDNDGDFTGGNYFTIQDDPASNYLRFGYGFNSDLVLNSSGHVGIGTSTPSSLFEVNNGTQHTALTGNNIEFSRNNGPAYFRSKNVGGYMSFVTNGRGLSNATANFVLKSNLDSYFNGNVGIGTTTPDEKLAVNGNIHAQEVRVDMIGWPDYVFASSYNLLSLEEVKQHIKEKGHLPNVPSEKEVLENGIELGAMNAKLLEKIEELTLYLLGQQGKIEDLVEDNKIMKKEMLEMKKELNNQ